MFTSNFGHSNQDRESPCLLNDLTVDKLFDTVCRSVWSPRLLPGGYIGIQVITGAPMWVRVPLDQG